MPCSSQLQMLLQVASLWQQISINLFLTEWFKKQIQPQSHRDDIVHQALAPTPLGPNTIFTYPLASLMYVLLQFHNSVQEVLRHASLLKLMEEKEVRTTTIPTKSMEPWTFTSLFVRVQSMSRISWILLGLTLILTAILPKIIFKSLAASSFVFSISVNSPVKLG